MDHISLMLIAAIAAICLVSTRAYYLPTELEAEFEPRIRDLDSEDSAHLRKLLLKKLRFREILKENMRSPDDVLADENDNIDEEALHKATKRHKMDDLMDKVKAYLSQYKERQIKESMSLPSLRFGRSGINYRH